MHPICAIILLKHKLTIQHFSRNDGSKTYVRTVKYTFSLSRLLTAGIPAGVLKEWMGHTNIHITLDTYADVFNRMNNEAIKMFEKYTCAIKYVEKTT